MKKLWIWVILIPLMVSVAFNLEIHLGWGMGKRAYIFIRRGTDGHEMWVVEFPKSIAPDHVREVDE